MNAKLKEGLDSDMLVTSAGVSKGDYDMVKDGLAQHGEIDFWSVRMRPAKPLAFGVLRTDDGREVPHLGLPGKPRERDGGVRAVHAPRHTQDDGQERTPQAANYGGA